MRRENRVPNVLPNAVAQPLQPYKGWGEISVTPARPQSLGLNLKWATTSR